MGVLNQEENKLPNNAINPRGITRLNSMTPTGQMDIGRQKQQVQYGTHPTREELTPQARTPKASDPYRERFMKNIGLTSKRDPALEITSPATPEQYKEGSRLPDDYQRIQQLADQDEGISNIPFPEKQLPTRQNSFEQGYLPQGYTPDAQLPPSRMQEAQNVQAGRMKFIEDSQAGKFS